MFRPWNLCLNCQRQVETFCELGGVCKNSRLDAIAHLTGLVHTKRKQSQHMNQPDDIRDHRCDSIPVPLRRTSRQTIKKERRTAISESAPSAARRASLSSSQEARSAARLTDQIATSAAPSRKAQQLMDHRMHVLAQIRSEIQPIVGEGLPDKRPFQEHCQPHQ